MRILALFFHQNNIPSHHKSIFINIQTKYRQKKITSKIFSFEVYKLEGKLQVPTNNTLADIHTYIYRYDSPKFVEICFFFIAFKQNNRILHEISLYVSILYLLLYQVNV
jgi:hypothetical protein